MGTPDDAAAALLSRMKTLVMSIIILVAMIVFSAFYAIDEDASKALDQLVEITRITHYMNDNPGSWWHSESPRWPGSQETHRVPSVRLVQDVTCLADIDDFKGTLPISIDIDYELPGGQNKTWHGRSLACVTFPSEIAPAISLPDNPTLAEFAAFWDQSRSPYCAYSIDLPTELQIENVGLCGAAPQVENAPEIISPKNVSNSSYADGIALKMRLNLPETNTAVATENRKEEESKDDSDDLSQAATAEEATFLSASSPFLDSAIFMKLEEASPATGECHQQFSLIGELRIYFKKNEIVASQDICFTLQTIQRSHTVNAHHIFRNHRLTREDYTDNEQAGFKESYPDLTQFMSQLKNLPLSDVKENLKTVRENNRPMTVPVVDVELSGPVFRPYAAVAVIVLQLLLCVYLVGIPQSALSGFAHMSWFPWNAFVAFQKASLFDRVLGGLGLLVPIGANVLPGVAVWLGFESLPVAAKAAVTIVSAAFSVSIFWITLKLFKHNYREFLQSEQHQ